MYQFEEKIAELTQCINSLFYDKIKDIKQPYPFHTKRKKSDCDLMMAASLISILKMAYQLIDLKDQYHKELRLLYQNNVGNKIGYASADKEDEKITKERKHENNVYDSAHLQLMENYRNKAKRLFHFFREQEVNNIENIMEYLKKKNLPKEKALEGVIFKENLTTLESLARKKRALNKINNDNPRIDNWDIQVFNRFMQEVRKRKIGIIKSFRRNLERPKSEEIAAKAEILYRENKLEVADIAEKLNITKNTLYSYLRYKNVPLHKSNKAYRQWISKSKSEPTAAKAEALYREEKLTVDEIAEKLGISSGTLYHYLHYRNVPTNRKSRSVSKSKVIGAKAEILYRENKLTVAEIAKKLSITPPTLYRCLRYRNVPIDKKSRAHAKWLSQFKATAARAEILYRKNKLTVAEITKKLGIAQPTLYQSLHYGNVPINKRSRVHSKWLSQFKATTAKAEILYRKNKLTVAKITKKLGISQPTLYRYLRYKNVPINRSSRMLSKSKTIAAKAEMLYRENKLAVTDITKKLGIGTGTLYRYLRYKNVPLNRANIALSKSKTIGTKAEILYRKNKLTVAEIAKELGIATGTLYRYLRYRKVALKRSSRVYKME